MSNPNGLLTRNMSPEQARLLDQQLRDTQFQGQQYGGRTGGFMTAASGAIQGAAKAGQGLSGMLTGKTYTGANEQAAVQQQQQRQDRMSVIKQGITKVAGSSLTAADKQLIITQLTQGTINPEDIDGMLKTSQQGVPTTTKFVDYVGMYAGNLEDFDSASIAKANAEFRKGRQEGEDDSDMYVRVTSPLIKKLSDYTKENAQELQTASKGYASFETSLPRMIGAIDNANVGLAGGFKQFMAKTIETITGDVVSIDSVKDSELLDRFFNKEVLAAAGLMTGALTNYDIEFLKQATGTREFSREGLKEAFKDLYVNKKVAYSTYKEFMGLSNPEKESFDIEGYQLGIRGETDEQASKMLGIDTDRKRQQRVLLPDQGTTGQPTMSFKDYFGNKNTGG